jgi:hypothetical protein
MSKKTTKRSYPSHEEISQLAYQIFEQEGCPHGRTMEHWLQAESILISARQDLIQTDEKKTKKSQASNSVSQDFSNSNRSNDKKKSGVSSSTVSSAMFARS